MDLGLKAKVAIVTGGGSNIGRAISGALAREGAITVIAELSEKDGQKVADQIKNAGGMAKVIKTDVTDNQSVQDMVKAVLDEFGKIDVLVNNVGWDDFTTFMEIPVERYDKYINLNFRHFLLCTRAVLPSMIERKSGRIINIGSDAGRIGEYRESIYSGCKAGVIGFSKAIAKEVGRFGITVNVVCPGATIPETDAMGEKSMFAEDWFTKFPLSTAEGQEKIAKSAYPLRRLGKAEDIANAVLSFASDAANYVTGQTLSVSGGYSML